MAFSSTVSDLFNEWGRSELLRALEASQRQLLERRRDVVEFGEPERLTPKRRAAANCQLLQQALLHRAERLLVSSGTVLLDSNTYGLALIIRGHIEATAMLGYFCSRLESLSAGNVTFEDFEWNVADAEMGARHSQFSEARPPLNVLTCLEKADKYLDKHMFKKRMGMLRDCYDWLSDFAHPNYLSNASAFTLDKPNNRFVLRHGGDLTKEDFDLAEYLAISADLFVNLFDSFTERAFDGLPAEGPIVR